MHVVPRYRRQGRGPQKRFSNRALRGAPRGLGRDDGGGPKEERSAGAAIPLADGEISVGASRGTPGPRRKTAAGGPPRTGGRNRLQRAHLDEASVVLGES